MGDWDLYCALCGTNASTVVDEHNIGSTNPLMLAIRRRIVLETKKRVESGEEEFPSPSFGEEDGEGLNESYMDWDWDDESTAYDPGLISEKDAEWQGDICCVGLNLEKDQYAGLSGGVVAIGY